jgi:hypothetical protein
MKVGEGQPPPPQGKKKGMYVMYIHGRIAIALKPRHQTASLVCNYSKSHVHRL